MASSSGRVRERITAVEFSLFSSKEILRQSVCNVTQCSVHSNGLPTTSGPSDFRMGTTDRRLLCGTCGFSVLKCPGHLGAITLAYPVMHPGYVEIALKILRCVCFFCSELLLNDKERFSLQKSRDRKQKLSAAAIASKGKTRCVCCNGQQPKYVKVGGLIRCDFSGVDFDDPEEALYCQRPFTASEMRLILQSISDASCRLLGLAPEVSRPESMILTALAVPPPIVRPSVSSSDATRSRGHDDLTIKLCDIVKANSNARLVLEREASTIPRVGLSLSAQQAVNDLGFHVSTFMNNDIRGQRQSTQRNGLPTKSITSRLKGKEGRIRGSLMGKRVNYSARSVVSPDSQMDVDEVGVPLLVALRMTYPEKVCDWNCEALRAMVRKGSKTLGGAHAVLRDEKSLLLEFADCEAEAKGLMCGDVVERYLQDGDVVLFNRQPSLHKGSMMAYRVRITPHQTFRLNMAATIPMNADCDGDELNVHLLQDREAQVEAISLMSVPQHIVGAQANKPCIGFVQDSVIGSWLMTHADVKIDRSQLLELLMCIHYHRPCPPHGTSFSGPETFSLLFPPSLCYSHSRTGVVVKDGQLISGFLCKQTLGATSGSIVHQMFLSYGAARTSAFISDAQRVVNRWLSWRGFSIRLSDCEPSQATEDYVHSIVGLSAQRVSQMRAVHPGEDSTCLENAVSAVANRVLTDVGKVIHASLDVQRNALYQAVSCGSKGNLINMAQLMGIVGQQSVEGRRIPVDPLFGNESDLEARGFVQRSYFHGLDSKEFFFHTMAGREGLIDTAVKTANTGYLQRKLMKAMETMVIAYDGTCRNSRDNIVEFCYGGDGFDAAFLSRASLSFLTKPWSELKAGFLCAGEREAFRSSLRRARTMRAQCVAEDFDAPVYTPCQVDQLLLACRSRRSDGPAATAAEVASRVDALCDQVCSTSWHRRLFMEVWLRWSLRSQRLAGLSLACLDWTMSELSLATIRAVVSPGEAVGALAAQSISEPLTQLTLNTFHMAGVKAKNVTLGIPRIKELIDCSRNTKAVFMKARPSQLLSSSSMKDLALHITRLTLSEVVSDVRVVGPVPAGEAPAIEDTLQKYERLLETEDVLAWPFVATMTLNPLPLLRRNLSPSDVAECMEKALHVHVSCSSEVDDCWILRVRLLSSLSFETSAEGRLSAADLARAREMTEEMVHQAYRDVVLGGIANVATCSVGAETVYVFDEEDDVRKAEVQVFEITGGGLWDVIDDERFDPLYCSSNDVHDTLCCLGVEAAAVVLFDELKQTLQFDGTYINDRHVQTLVNLMTYLGRLLPVSRHGINRLRDYGPLARASFEEVADQILEAAAFGDVDPCSGITEAVILGQRARIGTGMCSLQATVDAPGADDLADEEIVFAMADGDTELLEMCHQEDSTFVPGVLQPRGPIAFRATLAYEPSSPKQGPSGAQLPYAPSSPKPP